MLFCLWQLDAITVYDDLIISSYCKHSMHAEFIKHHEDLLMRKPAVFWCGGHDSGGSSLAVQAAIFSLNWRIERKTARVNETYRQSRIIERICAQTMTQPLTLNNYFIRQENPKRVETSGIFICTIRVCRSWTWVTCVVAFRKINTKQTETFNLRINVTSRESTLL